jgi:hypothetical protein
VKYEKAEYAHSSNRHSFRFIVASNIDCGAGDANHDQRGLASSASDIWGQNRMV